MTKYILNCWYVAAWSEELGTQPLARTLLETRVVLWRRAEGAAVAMQDRCPHRLAPLSRGTCKGETLACAYHGLEFNDQGQCVHNPLGSNIPAALKVRTFPLIERHTLLWIWMGDPAAADPSLIPDMSFNTELPGTRVIRGYIPMQAHYEIGNDNLLNLSHIEYLHVGTFAGAGVIFAGQYSAKRTGDVVDSNWWMPSIPPPPFARAAYPPDARVDHWIEMTWHAPSVMHLRVGVCAVGGPREPGINTQQAHVLTPAGPGQSHYFWSFARTDDVDSQEFDAFLRAQLTEAFNCEDKPMLEAIESHLDGARLWDERPVTLPIDVGAALAHKVIEERLAREVSLTAEHSRMA